MYKILNYRISNILSVATNFRKPPALKHIYVKNNNL
jgi:hypothetical protein